MIKLSKRTERMWCRNCRKYFWIDPNKPLNEQMPGHTWAPSSWGDTLQHITDEDRQEEQSERELCPYCGVTHGSNPYAGCSGK